MEVVLAQWMEQRDPGSITSCDFVALDPTTLQRDIAADLLESIVRIWS